MLKLMDKGKSNHNFTGNPILILGLIVFQLEHKFLISVRAENTYSSDISKTDGKLTVIEKFRRAIKI